MVLKRGFTVYVIQFLFISTVNTLDSCLYLFVFFCLMCFGNAEIVFCSTEAKMDG